MLKSDGKILGQKPAVEEAAMTAANSTIDERNYREAVETLMRLRSDKAISNSLPAHAVILFEAFFNNAKTRICIFCKNLSNEVFGKQSVVESAIFSLCQQKVGIDILIQEESPDPGTFVNFLQENKGNSLLRLRRAGKEGPRNTMLNFSVMDEQALRFEQNRNEVKAFAIMFAPNLAKPLVDSFDKMFAEAVPL